MYATIDSSTRREPLIIVIVGISPIPNHTQSGPKTISRSIIRLTIDAWVYLGAISKRAKENGEIMTPIIKTLIGAEKSIPVTGEM